MNDECIFCRIAKGEIPKDIIYENDNFMSFLDINPVVEGHSVVISKKHFENILEMPSSAGTELLDCVKKTAMKIMKEQKATGFNLIVNTFEDAGQVIKHFHLHILPRKKDDDVKMVV